MSSNLTPADFQAQQARAAKKLNEYTAAMHHARGVFENASTVAAIYGATGYRVRRYSSKGAARRDTPLSEKRCGGILLRDVSRLQRAMYGRGSWFPWRRRAAHAACLAMIQLREAAVTPLSGASLIV